MFSRNPGPTKSKSVEAFGFELSKVWELSFLITQSVGALVLSADSRPAKFKSVGALLLKRSKVWELTLQITQSVGALALNA